MERITRQMEEWAGDFGEEYTRRNTLSLATLESLYEEKYGITRTAMNDAFVGNLDRNMKVLEVGSNTGNQLLCLQKMGFSHLYGIELQHYAVEFSKSRIKAINLIQGSAFDLPFKDSYFDIVFTSGLLIHINPEDISLVMEEMHRCTSQYIWGMEYYAEQYVEIEYRGHSNMLWKSDFPKLFLNLFSDLELVEKQLYKYRDGDNADVMYLLKKKHG